MTRPVGAVTLGDLTFDQLEVACSSCERRGSYPVAKLIARHGRDMGLPDLASVLSADCPRRGAGIHDRCGVFYPGLQ